MYRLYGVLCVRNVLNQLPADFGEEPLLAEIKLPWWESFVLSRDPRTGKAWEFLSTFQFNHWDDPFLLLSPA